MNLFIDNTSFHAVGRCLQKEAKSIEDVDTLMQFASQLIFYDKIFISIYESPHFEEHANRVKQNLYVSGLSKDTLEAVEFIKVENNNLRKLV